MVFGNFQPDLPGQLNPRLPVKFPPVGLGTRAGDLFPLSPQLVPKGTENAGCLGVHAKRRRSSKSSGLPLLGRTMSMTT